MAKAGTHKGLNANTKFLVGLCRAAAGSIIFALPLLMTMETWQLGQYMDPMRLIFVTLLSLPLLRAAVLSFPATVGAAAARLII